MLKLTETWLLKSVSTEWSSMFCFCCFLRQDQPSVTWESRVAHEGRTATPAPSLLSKLLCCTCQELAWCSLLADGLWPDVIPRADLYRLQMWVLRLVIISPVSPKSSGDCWEWAPWFEPGSLCCAGGWPMPAQAEWWKQPRSAAVWQGDRTGAAHRELAVVTDDRSVGALFVQQRVWMADNYFFPSLPGRQKVLQAPNYRENLRRFWV